MRLRPYGDMFLLICAAVFISWYVYTIITIARYDYRCCTGHYENRVVLDAALYATLKIPVYKNEKIYVCDTYVKVGNTCN